MTLDLYSLLCERWHQIEANEWLADGKPDIDCVTQKFKWEDCGAAGQKQIRSHDAERESLFMPR